MRPLLISLVLLAACGGDNSAKKDAGVTSDAPVDTTTGGPDASCFTNPHTYTEIINACTAAQKIYKNTHPPLEGSDGSLPPLP
jgi:hypothetical protein